MEYTEETAKTIMELYNIPKQTIITWRNRSAIPNKYFEEGNVKFDVDTSKNISDADKYRLLQILESEHLNLSEFKSLSISKIADLKRGKSSITKNEFKAVKIELVNLKNKFELLVLAKSIPQKCKALKDLFKNPLLKPYSFAEGREHIYCIDVILNKDYEPNLLLLEQTVINCILFKQNLIL